MIIFFICFLLLSACNSKTISSDLPLATSPTTIPKKYLIKTTFVPQAPEKNWDQPWQDACEEAALLTLHYFYQKTNPSLDQIKQDILNLIDLQARLGMSADINIDQISLLAQNLGHQTTIITNPTITQIETSLANNQPILVTANGKQLYQENRHFSHGGPDYHALVILGFDQTKNQFIVHDVGTQHGAYFHYSYDTLLGAIHDLPSTGKKDIQTGTPKALIFY